MLEASSSDLQILIPCPNCSGNDTEGCWVCASDTINIVSGEGRACTIWQAESVQPSDGQKQRQLQGQLLLHQCAHACTQATLLVACSTCLLACLLACLQLWVNAPFCALLPNHMPGHGL